MTVRGRGQFPSGRGQDSEVWPAKTFGHEVVGHAHPRTEPASAARPSRHGRSVAGVWRRIMAGASR